MGRCADSPWRTARSHRPCRSAGRPEGDEAAQVWCRKKAHAQSARKCYVRRIMSATRSLWRSLLTVFQIVAFVAFALAGAGHSHAGTSDVGTSHVGHGAVAADEHPEASGPASLGQIADHAEPNDHGATSGPCSLCCCHTSFLRQDSAAVTVAAQPGRTLAGISTVAFDSVAPKTPSEPPRTVA